MIDGPLVLFHCVFQQIFYADLENPRQLNQLNIGDEALSSFNALDSVFVDFQPLKLQQICQLTLGNPHRHPTSRDLPAA